MLGAVPVNTPFVGPATIANVMALPSGSLPDSVMAFATSSAVVTL